ncbi:MAG: hypothetical protein AAFY88_22140, partial [Acidobacteriota bacterium]
MVVAPAGAGIARGDIRFEPPEERLRLLQVRLVRAVVAALWARSPVNLRPLLRTRKYRNPKGIALFAVSYLRRYRVFGDPADLEEAKTLLRWLEANIAPGYSGPC